MILSRRKIFTALAALPFAGALFPPLRWLSLGQSAQASEGVAPLEGDVDFKKLQSWIKEWPITQLSSEMAYVDTPEGKRLEHQTLALGTIFRFTDAEQEEANLKWNERITETESISEFLRSCSNYEAAELFLCRAVSNSLYFKALRQSVVYWREPPEIDVAFNTWFEPDIGGPHVDFTTDQRGHRHIVGGIVKLYTRLSFDDPDFYMDVPHFRDNGKVQMRGMIA